MKHVKHAFVPFMSLLLSATGCVDQPDVDEQHQAIINGLRADPKTLAMGITDTGCTVTMMSHDFGFTSAKCASGAKTVSIGGDSQRIRVVRRLADAGGTMRSVDKDIVTVQLWRTLAPKYGRGVDPQPLNIGDIVQCVAYDGTDLRSGLFEVSDSSTSARLFLRGRPNPNNLLDYEVAPSGVGGYCQRDGSFEIAAILTEETKSGVATAKVTRHLGGSLDDMLYAAAAADQGVAIRLRDARDGRFMDAPIWGVVTRVDGTNSPGTSHAFYLDDVRNPPGGGFDWYRLVDAATGQCQTARTFDLVTLPCDPRDRNQMFYSEYISSTGHYRFHAVGGVLDAVSTGQARVDIKPAGSDLSQRWDMWLTRY